MRLRDLRKYIEKNQRYGVDTTLQKVSYHSRVAHVFSPLIFVLLGLVFVLNPLKSQSAAKGVALSFLLVFVYLIMSKMSVSIGKSGQIPAFLAAWLPNMLFLGFGVLKIAKR
jgi:lipopolysaccharide export system permease protein